MRFFRVTLDDEAGLTDGHRSGPVGGLQRSSTRRREIFCIKAVLRESKAPHSVSKHIMGPITPGHGGAQQGPGRIPMKLHAVAAAIAIVLVIPASAQDTSQTSPSAQSTPVASPDQNQTKAADGPPSPVDSAAATAPTATAPKETHNKNKNDVDDIGDRKVGGTGKSLGNWYSVDTDVKLGKQYAMMVESSARMIQDPVIVEYVNRVGQNLVRNSDAKVPFTIKVVDSDDVNAFALPGGFFYVNSGLVLAADNEAELAGVMAHEIAHVAARHATRGMTRANYIQT